MRYLARLPRAQVLDGHPGAGTVQVAVEWRDSGLKVRGDGRKPLVWPSAVGANSPFAAAVRRSGGVLIADERIHTQALIAALDAAEATA